MTVGERKSGRCIKKSNISGKCKVILEKLKKENKKIDIEMKVDSCGISHFLLVVSFYF